MIASACDRFSAALPATLLAGLLLALAGCDGSQPPGPNASPGTASLPADHPPVGDPATTAAPLPPDTVLATAGDRRVTVADVQAALAGMDGADRLGYATPGALRELVEMLADRTLMAAAARADGFAADPVMKEMLGTPPPGTDPDQMLAEVWLQTELANVPAPDAAEIERYYREHPEEFTEPARVRVTRATAATQAEAGRLRADLAGGAANGEQLWLQDAPKAPEATTVALGLAPRAVSPVLTAGDGFVVLRVEEKAPARLRGLGEVSDGIRAGIENRRRQEALDALRLRVRDGVPVQVDEAALASFLPAVQAGR